MFSIVQAILVFSGGALVVFFVYQAWSLIQLRRFSSVPELYEGSLNLMNIMYSDSPEKTRRRWLNYGMWYEDTKTYEEACDNLALKMAVEGEFSSSDRILDVGCGMGTSTRFWMDHVYKKENAFPEITGLNITPGHIAIARRDAEADGRYGDRIRFELGDATRLEGYKEKSFSKVAALECAFHFDTREDFIHEAFRVLEPGGVLVCADIILKPWAPAYHKFRKVFPEFLIRPWFSFFADLASCPVANHIDTPGYHRMLEEAGFSSIKSESIMPRARVTIEHYRRSAAAVKKGDVPEWVQPFDRKKFMLFHRMMTFINRSFALADYIVVTARKTDDAPK